MALRLEDKKRFVKEVNAVAGDSITAVVQRNIEDYPLAEMTDLRKRSTQCRRISSCCQKHAGSPGRRRH